MGRVCETTTVEGGKVKRLEKRQPGNDNGWAGALVITAYVSRQAGSCARTQSPLAKSVVSAKTF